MAVTTFPAQDPAYIGITLKVQSTSQLDRGQAQALRGTTPTTNPVTVQTGVDLRGFP